MTMDVRETARRLERGELPPEEALSALVPAARLEPRRADRVEAWRAVGDLAGRAHGASWSVAEQAAWALLDVARHIDAPVERRALLGAMGRGFRNLWLVPFVHARLADPDPLDAAAAIGAAGGLGFAGLESALAARFLGAAIDAPLRHAAIGALGRMGAVSAADVLVTRIDDPHDCALALTALTEIHTPSGAEAAIAVLDRDPPRDSLLAATRYLSSIGREQVLPTLRRLARHEDAEMRMAAALSARALKAERNRDAAERILAALTERDRAVRSLLARRLRTLPAPDVLAQAEMLLEDDPRGILQILAEVRTAEVSRFLLDVAGRRTLPPRVRARALLSMEADEPWEREALVEIASAPDDEPTVRSAAATTMGAFATVPEVLDGLEAMSTDPAPAVRGALLWALQLAAIPGREVAAEATRCEALFARALADEDAFVRRRAAYVTGNLDLAALAEALARLARDDDDRPDVRIAAFVGAGEIASPDSLGELVALFRREQDPEALAAVSRAIAQVLSSRPDAPAPELARLGAKLGQLLGAADPLLRRSAVRLAGLSATAVPVASVVALAEDRAPGVREEVVTALGRLDAPEAETILADALEDVDAAIRERAAEALVTRGGLVAVERLLAWISSDDDADARAAIAERLPLPAVEARGLLPALDAALARLSSDDAVTEPLLALKVRILEQDDAPVGEQDIEAAIVAAFPTYARLSQASGFAPLGRSMRTAEALCRTAGGIEGGDLSPPISLWTKVLEGYLHAWLAPRLANLQRDPARLWEHVDRLLGDSWPAYQKYLQTRWSDPVDVGNTRVELPLRALPNALRELQERRLKRVDQPLSVTEWARILLLLAVDHPSGVRNVLRVSATSADNVVHIGHRLLTLAAVRNVVTHRAVAGAATLDAFRRTYYASFEDLTRLA